MNGLAPGRTLRLYGTMRMAVVGLLSVAFLSSTATILMAEAKRAITHPDLWLMKRVGSPTVSPDGRWAVFSVTEPAYDAKDQVSDLWLVPVDGSEPARRITATKTSETGADWSPDGTRLAFSAKREGDETNQIYVLDLKRGGDAQRITDVASGAKSPQWSPDGQSLLFVGEVYSSARDDQDHRRIAKERKDRKWNARVYEGFPVRYWDRWLDDREPRLFVQEARPGATAKDLLAGTRLVSEPGFGGRQTDSGEELPAAWAPDGKSVILVATTQRHRSAYAAAETQIFQIELSGGEARALTSDPHGYGNVAFSPDGRHLVVEFAPGGDGKIYHHDRLAHFPWPFRAEARRVLTEGLDLSVADFVISEDSRTVYFTAEAGAYVTLFSVPVTGGSLSSYPSVGGVLSGLSIGSGQLVSNHESAARPAEVGRIELPTGTWVPVTSFNREALAPLDLPPLEHFTVKSALGRDVHTMLVRPAGFSAERKYPLFAMIHGGPAPQFRDAWGLRWNYHLIAAPGYVVLLTNYTGSRGYSEAFGQAIQGDPLKTPAEEINQAVDEAIRRFPFVDADRLAAGGASYGGHLANWLQATTTRYKALISHAGLVNLETQWSTSDAIYHRELSNGGPVWEQGPVWREQNPVRLVRNHFDGTGWKTPMLLTVGEQDFRVPFNNTLENWTYHQRLQIPSKLIVFPDENHWILKGENSRFWYGEIHAWLAKWLRE